MKILNNNPMEYERIQLFSENVGNRSISYNVRNIAKKCPHCKTQIYPKLICIDGDELMGYSLFCRCPNCNQHFICKCDKITNKELIFVLSDVKPNAKLDKRVFSSDIQGGSESFCEIYNQAYAAHQLNLTQICGVGYRKALEYLIKDYIITERPDKKETILRKTLGNCIREDIDSENIKNVAERATWLGNDETHYIRKWEDKDITDLVNTIDLTLHWIEAEIQTKKLLEQMPEGR